MLPNIHEIELPSDKPMPSPAPTNRKDFYVSVPVALQCDQTPTLNLKPGKIGISASGDDDTEMLLQLVQTGSDFQTPTSEKIVGVSFFD